MIATIIDDTIRWVWLMCMTVDRPRPTNEVGCCYNVRMMTTTGELIRFLVSVVGLPSLRFAITQPLHAFFALFVAIWLVRSGNVVPKELSPLSDKLLCRTTQSSVKQNWEKLTCKQLSVRVVSICAAFICITRNDCERNRKWPIWISKLLYS